MDLIVNTTTTIDPPENTGTYYLALHLARDSSNNVLGDLVYGSTRTFQGVYLTYFNDKPDPVSDMDILYLGKVTWNGTAFSNITEDDEKYGKLWASDIICKVHDWKHEDTKNLVLQQYLYKLPDWYVSKEGDVIFGDLEFLPERDPNIPGTYSSHEDLGTGRYGLKVHTSSSGSGTEIVIKDPSESESDRSKTITILERTDGITMYEGPTIIDINYANGYKHILENPNGIILKGGNPEGLNATQTTLDIGDQHFYVNGYGTSTINKFTLDFLGDASQLKFGNNFSLTIFSTSGGGNLAFNSNNRIEASSTGMDIYVGSSNLTVHGELTADKVYGAVYNDFGEIMRKSKDENIEYGDILCIGNDGLVHKVQLQSDLLRIVGICSNTIGMQLGGSNIPKDEQVEVGMLGQIWVKTNDTYLVPGHLVKALPDGTVGFTGNVNEKFGICLTENINGKVKIFYKG